MLSEQVIGLRKSLIVGIGREESVPCCNFEKLKRLQDQLCKYCMSKVNNTDDTPQTPHVHVGSPVEAQKNLWGSVRIVRMSVWSEQIGKNGVR